MTPAPRLTQRNSRDWLLDKLMKELLVNTTKLENTAVAEPGTHVPRVKGERALRRVIARTEQSPLPHDDANQ